MRYYGNIHLSKQAIDKSHAEGEFRDDNNIKCQEPDIESTPSKT